MELNDEDKYTLCTWEYLFYSSIKRKNQHKKELSLIPCVQRELFINFTKRAHYRTAPILVSMVTKHYS